MASTLGKPVPQVLSASQVSLFYQYLNSQATSIQTSKAHLSPDQCPTNGRSPGCQSEAGQASSRWTSYQWILTKTTTFRAALRQSLEIVFQNNIQGGSGHKGYSLDLCGHQLGLNPSTRLEAVPPSKKTYLSLDPVLQAFNLPRLVFR